VQPVRAVHSEARALAEFGGVNVHAEVAIDGRDRERIEHVLRYMARPPLALDRLSLRDDGRVVYRFKKAWRDGTHAVVLSPAVPETCVHTLKVRVRATSRSVRQSSSDAEIVFRGTLAYGSAAHGAPWSTTEWATGWAITQHL